MKKQAPTRFNKKKDTIQFCIDGVYVEEVLRSLPKKGVQIIGCKIRFGMPLRRQKVVIPIKLRKMGCSYLQQIAPALEAEITLDKTTPADVRKAVKGVSEHIGVEPDRATFSYLTLTNGQGSGKFVTTTKEMAPKNEKDALDLRKKARMLGLEDAAGKIQTLISDLGAGKFQCNFQDVQIKQISLCKRVG